MNMHDNIMNRRLGFFKFLFLNVAAFGFSRAFYSDFDCFAPNECRCSRSSDFASLRCKNGSLRVYIDSGKASIYCEDNFTYMDYDILNNSMVVPVEKVIFDLCPMPNMPLGKLVQNLGIQVTNELEFVSRQDYTLETISLKGLENITTLILAYNGILNLPVDWLQGLNNLTTLNLAMNKINHLDKSFFSFVPKLEYLFLGANNLTQLDVKIFTNLTKLKELDLSRNKLKNLPENIFSDLISLDKLDISFNEFQTLPDELFKNLGKLVNFSICFETVSSLPKNFISSNLRLQEIRLHDNRGPLTLPDNFLADLIHLKKVYLMRNNLSIIPETIFSNSTSITDIFLQESDLKSIPKNLFSHQIYLRTLNLSCNRIESLHDFTFQNLKGLQTLWLSNNKLEEISRKVFSGLFELESLHLESNQLKYLHYAAFKELVKLKEIELSHNHLTFEDKDHFWDKGIMFSPYYDDSPVGSCKNIENVYLSNNSIRLMFIDWRFLPNLRIFNISHNKIQVLNLEDIKFQPEGVTLDLRNNNVTIINFDGIQSRPITHRVLVLLDENPLKCDCRSYEFINYIKGEPQPKITVEVSGLTCDQGTTLVKKADINNLTCPINDPKCPFGCDCFSRNSNSALVVNCTGKGLTEVPKTLPFQEKIEHTNEAPEHKKLEHSSEIHPYYWISTINHIELFLNNNYITKFPNIKDQSYLKVTHLYLSNNRIKEIEANSFLSNLQVLTLDNNQLQQLSGSVLKYLTDSTEIRLLTLHNNPWLCNCSTTELFNFIHVNVEKIPNLTRISCASDNRQISKLSIQDLCPPSILVTIAAYAVPILGIIIASIAALYYRYQKSIKIWLYSKNLFLWFVTEEEVDKDKIYDAFVSYSHQDEEFVMDVLVDKLESEETPYKLCVHIRDWIPGEMIPDQIARSVEESRRTLIVLSPNFLESIWGKMEFRVAHQQALKEGRARVILILYGDIGPVDQLDSELKAYISMNTYLKWDDPWFWEKLKYALPHRSNLLRRNERRDRGQQLDNLEL